MESKKFVAAALATMFGASVLMTGCGSIDKNATLIDINDGADTISLGYGNFAARYQQSIYDQYLLTYYGESMWTTDMSSSGQTFQEDVKDDVIDTIEEEYLCKVHAADYGVELTEDDETKIADAAKEFMEANPEDTLETMGATEDIVKQYLENRTYYTLVNEAAKEAANVEVTDEECWQRTFSYVRYSTTGTTDTDGNTVEYSDEEIAAIKEDAEALAAAGDDFDSVAEEQGQTVSTYSYTKGDTEDSFGTEVIEAAEKLKEGEISSVIEVEGTGYYVIRLDADHDEEASETERESLKTSKETEAFTTLMDSWKKETTFTVDEKAWSKVEFGTLFKAMETEEEDTETEAEQ